MTDTDFLGIIKTMIFLEDNIALGLLDSMPDYRMSALDLSQGDPTPKQELAPPASSQTQDPSVSLSNAAGEGDLAGQFLLNWFRVLSAAEVVKHYFWHKLVIDFSEDGVLQNAVPLAFDVPIYPNHDRNIAVWLGKTVQAKWTESINKNPIHGITAHFRQWTGLDQKGNLRSQYKYDIAEGVRQGVISRVSSGLLYRFRRSHPDMDESIFYRMMGKDVDGEKVRLIATEILNFVEFSEVQMGADKYAEKEKNLEMEMASEFSYPVIATFSGSDGYAPFIKITIPGGFDMDPTKANLDNPQDGDQGKVDLAVSLNSKGVGHCRSLINAGKYNTTASWEFTAADGNKLLGDNDWTRYGRMFLGVDSAQDAETKGHYKYPFGKLDGNGNEIVYRQALIAATARGAQQGVTEISNSARDLREALDKKAGISSGKSKQDDQLAGQHDDQQLGDLEPGDVSLQNQSVTPSDGDDQTLSASGDQTSGDSTPSQDTGALTLEDAKVQIAELNVRLTESQKGFDGICRKYQETLAATVRLEQQATELRAEQGAKDQVITALKEDIARLSDEAVQNAGLIVLGKQYLADLRSETETEYLKYCDTLREIPEKAVGEEEKAAMLARIKDETTDVNTLRELLATFSIHNRAILTEGRDSIPGNGSSVKRFVPPLKLGENFQYLYRK